MINVSEEFRRTMQERTDFRCHAQVTLADGQTLTLTDEDFTVGGNRLTDGAGASGLPLGAAVCRTAELSLINDDGRLDGYDFYGARIRLWLTFRLSETEERIELGTFTVTEPESRGETVVITTGDDMALADKPFASRQTGEMTLGGLFRDVCEQSGLHYVSSAFPNSDMAVTAPEEEHTCREMLGYIAMLAGGNARIDRQGTVRLLSYDREKAPDHELTDWVRLSVDTDDVIVTGLELETEEGTVLEGEAGYVLQVENPLAAGREAEALRRMGDVLLGLRLRKFEGSHIGYPLAECMDTVRFQDRRGRTYTSWITDVTFTFGGTTELSDSAEGVVRNGSRYVSGETRAKLEARKLTKQERSARELAVRALQKTLDESGGMYMTDAKQPDGSSIWYLHDKPTLEASGCVVKVTANALGLSTDGGKSYPFGITIDGEMIMEIIQTEGLNADWVTSGVFQSRPDASGKRKFYMNTETGDVDLEVRNLTIAGKSVNQALSDAVTSVEQQFYLSTSSTSLAGGNWSSTQPAWAQGKYIWSRQYVTYGNGTSEYLPSETGVCITGNTGADGTNGTNGTNGKDGTNGVGVESVVAEYCKTKSASSSSGGTWSTAIPTVTDGEFIWYRQKITYTNGDVKYTGAYCMSKTVGDIAQQKVDAQTQTDIFNKLTNNGALQGVFMRDGQLYINASYLVSGVFQSRPDASGKRKFYMNTETGDVDLEVRNLTIAGQSVNQALSDAVTSVEQQFYLSTSSASLSGGNWSSTQPTWTQGKYIWSRQYVTYGSGSSEYLPSETGVCITGNTGADGKNGTNGTNGTNGKDGANGTDGRDGDDGIGIESVVAEYYTSTSATTPTGGSWSSTMPTVQNGKFIWFRQKITYSDGNVKYAGQYCMTKTVGDIAQQKVDAQTQTDIFNKLTNNGALQGVFMRDGQLYVNASYLRGDTIDLNLLRLLGTLCGLMQGYGATAGGQTTQGLVIFGNGRDSSGRANPPYFIVTNAGIRGQVKDEYSFNMGGNTMEVHGNLIAQKSGTVEGDIRAEGSGIIGGSAYVGGAVYVGDQTAVWYNSVDNTMKYGHAGVRAWLTGKQTYVGEVGTSDDTYVRGNTVYIKSTSFWSDAELGILSDRRMKKDIQPLDEAYARALDRITPVRFRYKSQADDGLLHMGYIAQDVQAALEAEGLGGMGLVGEYTDEDGNARLGLAYDELIAMLHSKINSLEAEIRKIKEELA